MNSYYDIEKMLHQVLKAFDPSHIGQAMEIWETDGLSNEEIEIEEEDTVERDVRNEGIEAGTEEVVNNRYEGFGKYAMLAEKIDQFIVNEMNNPAFRMKNITGGIGYHKNPKGKMYSFAKLFQNNHPFLLLRFGKKSEGDHKGIMKQIEFDRRLGHQPRRNLSNIYDYPNEAFIYLENLIEHNNEQTWNWLKENIEEAFRDYYKVGQGDRNLVPNLDLMQGF